MGKNLDDLEEGHSVRFAYFMVRVETNEGASTVNISGIVERLGSGLKQPFSGPGELIRLLTFVDPDATRSHYPPPG